MALEDALKGKKKSRMGHGGSIEAAASTRKGQRETGLWRRELADRFLWCYPGGF